ncbi:class I SAM-dependent methyltransferase family protein [Patescibacteria group bacterium]|nr:class I SAM-dependent methyltransferase family protein [Patescibacteria group bacterium]MBU2472781.1 class I SAM-dependent methyltransferase family protein [Patescibacteria group bacterium]
MAKTREPFGSLKIEYLNKNKREVIFMLLHPGTGMESLNDYKIRIGKGGVVITTLTAEDFNGEHDQRSWLYVLILHLVSIWAAVTNFTQALFIKTFKKRKSSFGKILWEMGRDSEHVSSFFGDRFSQINHQTISGAASWRSLDIVYNYHEKIKPQLNGGIESWLTKYWIGKLENRQAIANRLKIVVNLLTKAFAEFADESEIRIVSMASGSAQAVIDAMLRCPHLNIKAVLIDIDRTALVAAKDYADENGFGDRFAFVEGTTGVLEKVCQEFQPHIIEMVGFLDYRPTPQAIKLINKIKNCLPENGIFLTCNINYNREKIFLDWVMLWPMIYRNEDQFEELLLKGGFSPQNVYIVYEPFKIHGIGVCQN